MFLDRATPSYTALLDRDGDVVAALADMGLYELAFAKQMRRAKVREAMAEADAVLCDANLPEPALVRLAEIAADHAAVCHRDFAGQGGAAEADPRQAVTACS